MKRSISCFGVITLSLAVFSINADDNVDITAEQQARLIAQEKLKAQESYWQQLLPRKNNPNVPHDPGQTNQEPECVPYPACRF
jgi:hypothetical protein